ncbi:hypothetical protein JMJ35_006506 [Cladonia borealis]|uniref:Cell wall protein n=1 Tax=Cladonia borealis TaxID=184061 RepID=A0AA39QZ54_9LECA|nr:hypothetical protein JMJ35_006506 [Cladonia borealis]
MKLSVLVALTVVNFASYAFAQFSTDITVDSNGKKVYIAAAATSSVAAPASTPTLVYNCYYMPLICENVANFAKDINPGGGGDLGAMQLFYFDPDQSHKESRRTASCGCFQHDDCPLAKSNGKQAGTLVTQIGNQAPMNGLNTPINAASQQILLAGSNPGVLPNTNNAAPRVPLQTVPGRFFQQGVAFTCDEFPAATFINGGSDAKTICALQSWQVFSGSYNSAAPSANKGKWPLVSKSGQRREQDWQAQSHVYLRQAFGIKGSNGLGTVYPFSFTTTTMQAATKAYVVKAGPVTKVVNKRDGNPTFTTYAATTTVDVFGNEELESEDCEFQDSPVKDVNEKTPPAFKIPPNPRFKRQFAATQTSTVSTSSSVATNLAITRLNFGTGASSAMPRSANSSAVNSSASLISLSVVSSSSDSGTGASSTALFSGSASTATANASLTSLSGVSSSSDSGTGASSTALFSGSASTATANAPSNYLGASISSSNQNSSLVSTASSSIVSFSATVERSPTIGIASTVSTLETSSTPASSTAATSLGAISTSYSSSKPSSVTTSALQSTSDIVAGNPAATSSASVVSSNVASASSAAAALVADPSNSQKAQAAQQQTNDAKEAASSMLARAISGSPLANALSSLFATLGTAASAASAVVDASTPAAASAAASELLSDLNNAATDAEDVQEESKDDDDEPSNSPSNSPSASMTSPSTASQSSSTASSSQSTPSSITSSASSASSSSASSSTTSSSASAGPSVCTLAFDEDGDEDIEVGDDYTDDTVDLDPTTADDIACMPIYGSGGSIIPCSASASGSAASSSAASSTAASSSAASSSAASPSGAGTITGSQNSSATVAPTTELASSIETSTISTITPTAPATPTTPATSLDPAESTTENSPPSSTILPSSTPPPPYATGTCSFHLIETQDCASDSSNLFANVTLYDNDKSVIGQTNTDDDSVGEPINASDPYEFDSKLPNAIVITGEHEGDYVQFTYGSLSWRSRTTTGSATCSNGGWDPRQGPVCDERTGDNEDAVNNMDCSFPC